MLYQLFRIPILLLSLTYFRRIYWTGGEHIPANAPTIIASNHSTAFMEQMLVASLFRRSVYFWAGGGTFERQQKLTPLFRALHIIPIWRREEGLKKMQRNKQVFEDSKALLLTNKMLYIAPEGSSVSAKRLQPFKTGTARIALMTAAANNFEKDVFILPTGVNYTNSHQFRSEVMINVGQAINVKHYKQAYAKDPRGTVKQLTKDLKAAIAEQVIEVDAKEDDALVEQLLTLFRNQYKHHEDRLFEHQRNRLPMEQAVAKFVNQLDASRKEKLRLQMKDYFQALSDYQVDDRSVKEGGRYATWRWMLALLMTPAEIAGRIGGYLPMRIARLMLHRQIGNKQYWAPMAIAFALIAWSLYAVFLVGIGSLWLGWNSLCLPFLAAFLQYLSILNKENWETIFEKSYYLSWQKNNPQKAQDIIDKRQQIIQTVEPAIGFSAIAKS